MELKNYNTHFFLGTLILISVVTFYIFQPFLIAILLAAILAILFQKMYVFFIGITGQRKSLSSMITSLIILLLIVVPLVFVISLIGNEIMGAYKNSIASGDIYQKFIVSNLSKIQSSPLYRYPVVQQALSKDSFFQYSSQIGQSFFVFAQNAYQGVAHVFFLVFVIFFSLFYLLMDGRKLVEKIMYMSPLKNAHEKLLIQKFVSMSRATIKGTLLIGIVQGIIGAIIFVIVGIPSVVTWGFVMGILSIIPLFGSGLIWFPAALIMLILGHIWQGIFILVSGFAIVSTIDNILRPKLVGRDTQMHPLLVFFATLGGLALFGFVGFIIGPIVVVLFVSLWDIYGVEFKTQLKKYNK